MTSISPIDDANAYDSEVVISTTDDTCTDIKQVETSHNSIESTEDSEKVPPPTTEDDVQQADDAPVVVKAAVPRKPAWGMAHSGASKASTTTSEGGSKPTPSFADIMNDQSQDREVARLAYTNDVVDERFSLSEIQAEQERIFASLASSGKEESSSTNSTQEATGANEIDPMMAGLDEEERRMIELAMKASLEESKMANNDSNVTTSNDVASSEAAALPTAETSKEEAERLMIEAAIREADARENQAGDSSEGMDAKPAAVKTSQEDLEREMIEAAIREADAKERTDAEAESLKLVMQLQQEEMASARQRQQHQQRTSLSSGNVRTMTREELAAETYGNKASSVYENGEFDYASETGFRMNQQNQDQLCGWYRRDRNTIVGPDNEIRTKHDVRVQGQTNASFLDLDVIDDDTGLRSHVGNKAFNDFRRTAAGSHHTKSHRGTTKGVATYGTGRAGSDADATKGGAMDQQVRLHISKAINAGIIERCNGVVKQGKEAVVYHAVGGPHCMEVSPIDNEDGIDEDSTIGDNNEGSKSKIDKKSAIKKNDQFDVAIKVFKRIKEFRGRGEYVDGDPRYAGRAFRSFTDREQLEVWTEKEFRNLVRAYRAQVPVPNPIRYKDNIIFMRFLGQDGWPAPQIRELNIRKGSSKWSALLGQVMSSVQKLFQDARLVHGDLSEYNILIAPNSQVDHKSANIGSEDDLQTALIDFGQAVEVRHPKAKELLERDLTRVKEFFTKQGVKTTMSLDDAMAFVVGDYSFSAHLNECMTYDD